jgi:hypothetical protein
LQVRFEKRSIGDRAGVVTWVLSYTYSKQHARCCVGQNRALQPAIASLSPKRLLTGTLNLYPYTSKDANLV